MRNVFQTAFLLVLESLQKSNLFLEIFEKRYTGNAEMLRLIANSRRLLSSQDDLRKYML